MFHLTKIGFSRFLVRSGKLWAILGTLGSSVKLWGALGTFGWLWEALGYSERLWGALGWEALGCSGSNEIINQ